MALSIDTEMRINPSLFMKWKVYNLLHNVKNKKGGVVKKIKKVCVVCEKEFETIRKTSDSCKSCVKKRCQRAVSERNKSPYVELGINSKAFHGK